MTSIPRSLYLPCLACALALGACHFPTPPWQMAGSTIPAARPATDSGPLAAGPLAVGPHAAAVSPLHGRVESIPRRVQALVSDIAAGATVSLIEPTSGRTLATTVSTPTGGFILKFSDDFEPVVGEPYILEAVKGLPVGGKANRAGAPGARVRTVVNYTGGWRSLSGDSIVISRATTAVAIMASHQNLDTANLLLLMGKVSDATFDTTGTILLPAAFNRVLTMVTEAIGEDQDPVESIGYLAFGPPIARYERKIGGVVLHDKIVPAIPTRSGTFMISGQNLPGPGAATPSLSIGGALVKTWSVNAERTRLTIEVPADASTGRLEISQQQTNGIGLAQARTFWSGPVIPVKGTTGTLAGANGAGWVDGDGRTAKFTGPHGITFDPSGNLYVSELQGHRIRKINTYGVVTTFAGDGVAGSQDGTGIGARFNNPRHLWCDAAGNLYVSDSLNLRVRRISPTGAVSTLATSGTFVQNPGNPKVFGGTVTSVVTDPAGNLYVAEYETNRIVKVSTAGAFSVFVGDGVSSNTDGTGTGARLSGPVGMWWGADNFLYSANNGANHLKRISTTGQTATLQTNGNFVANGPAVDPNAVQWVARGPDGTVFSVYANYVHKIVPGTGIVPIVGDVDRGAGYVDGVNSTVLFGDWPYGGTVDANGVLYVTDSGNQAIRVVTP